jgi:hypothetical protein
MATLIEHRNQIAGVLSCYDRVVIRGTLPSVCYANAMATTLDVRGIRLFDHPRLFAEPLRDAIKWGASGSHLNFQIPGVAGRRSPPFPGVVTSHLQLVAFSCLKVEMWPQP